MDLVWVLPVLLGSLVVSWFARWRGWPAPLLVTVVAMVVSLKPGVPQIDIDGELVLWVVLPPLLYSAALDSSFISFRESLAPIRRLGIGLVVATTVVVASVTMLIFPQIGWAGALLLGAIVSPPDAVSAASIGRKLGLPRRVMTVILGESLVNDATSLTLYRVFTAVVAGATVSWLHGIGDFAWAVISGVGLGLALGWIVHQIRMRVSDTVLVSTVGLLVPFIAYGIGEFVHGSGVLVVVFTGLYVGLHAPLTRYTTRMQERPLWSSLDALLEGAVFALIGLQIAQVVAEIDFDPELTKRALLLAGSVLLTVIALRPVWVFGVHALMRQMNRLRAKLPHAEREPKRKLGTLAPQAQSKAAGGGSEPDYSWKELTVISWTGMRGVVTLATAAALPAAAAEALGASETRVIFAVAFVVTIGTLLIQGMTLSPLIRWLGVADPNEAIADAEQASAVRERAAREGMAYLERMRPLWNQAFGNERTEAVFARFATQINRAERDVEHLTESTERLQQVTQLTRDWLAIRRNVLIEEMRAGHLSEEVMRELITAMDAEELALDARIDSHDRLRPS